MTTFLPTDLSNLGIWFKADAITGLIDNDPVATWPDSSGNARDATQGTVGLRPLYKTAVQNGLPVVRFDGTDDYLVATYSAAATQPVTMLLVASVSSTTGNDQFIHAVGMEFFQYNASNGLGMYAGTQIGEQSVQPLTMSVMSAMVNGAGSVWRRRGRERAAGNAGAGSFGTTVNVGRHASIGTRYLQGDIAEFALWDADHSASWSEIERYAADKWLLPLVSAPPAPSIRRYLPNLVR